MKTVKELAQTKGALQFWVEQLMEDYDKLPKNAKESLDNMVEILKTN